MTDTETRGSASTFAKGLAVLECFGDGETGLTMAGIAKRTGLDRAAVRRLCLTLVETGYLIQNEREFRLTPRILALAGGFLAANDFGRAVQPVLNHFAQELNGEISMAMRDRGRAIYVAQSAMPGSRLSIGFVVGSSIPLLHTSLGRMLLAQGDPEDLERLLRNGTTERYTEATDTDPSSIRAKVLAAAEHGYALVRDEFEMGATALAVPIGTLGRTEAVIGTTLPSSVPVDGPEFERVLEILRRAARSLRGHQTVRDA